MDKYNQLINFYNDSEKKLQQEVIDDFYEILQNNSDINQTDEGYTILIRLAWAGRLDLVKLAMDAGADINAVSNDNSFALYEAARQGWQEVYDYLAPLTSPELKEIAASQLPKGLIYRQRKNNHVVEAFVHAALWGNIDIVSTAIARGIDINAISSNGEAALHKAIRNNQLSIVQILLESGANPNLRIEEDREYTPLMIALSRPKINNAIFQALLNAGADINQSSSEGVTVLMLAVASVNLQAVRQLLKLGVEINAKNMYRQTALHYAKKMREQTLSEYTEPSEIIQLLESYGAL
jgi:ankyrin repeat protein